MDFPEKWRNRFGNHPDFVPLEEDEDLQQFASVESVNARTAKLTWLKALSDSLDRQADELMTLNSRVPGTDETLRDLTSASLGAAVLDPATVFRLANLVKDQRALAAAIREKESSSPSWAVPSPGRGKRLDIGFGRACEVVADRIRFYKGNRKTSWPMVVECLRWFGHEIPQENPEDAVRLAAARYIRWLRKHGSESPS